VSLPAEARYGPQTLEVELSSIARQISVRRTHLFSRGLLMLPLLAGNLKLILVFIVMATIVGLSYFRNEQNDR
jgi:hypothetical protein